MLGGEAETEQCAAKCLGETGDEGVGEEGEARARRELEAEAAEEIWTWWAGGGGHGLEVGPGGLLHEAVADGDLVAGAGCRGGGRRVHGGGGGGWGEEVFERRVGFGALEGEELQVELRRRRAGRDVAVLGGEAGGVEAVEMLSGSSGGEEAEIGRDHNGCGDGISAAELPWWAEGGGGGVHSCWAEEKKARKRCVVRERERNEKRGVWVPADCALAIMAYKQTSFLSLFAHTIFYFFKNYCLRPANLPEYAWGPLSDDPVHCSQISLFRFFVFYWFWQWTWF